MAFTAPADAAAQRADSTRAGVSRTAPRTAADTSAQRSIAPRRAFLTSLIAPGLMQLRLGRPKAATLFLAAEAGTIGMSVKSWNDLSKAKAAKRDTVGTPVVDGSGKAVIDTTTGLQKITYAPRDPNLVGRIRARRAHLEDWIAVLVFNHLFAGADAYVAANLADVNANVQVSSSDRDVRVTARVAW
ncbi:MAG: hypothetical protein Q7S20_01755 [Gemmatimonadaceae bacterium]|nr:hypothetical protein [Gemmatimonadaceae bacterium]